MSSAFPIADVKLFAASVARARDIVRSSHNALHDGTVSFPSNTCFTIPGVTHIAEEDARLGAKYAAQAANALGEGVRPFEKFKEGPEWDRFFSFTPANAARDIQVELFNGVNSVDD